MRMSLTRCVFLYHGMVSLERIIGMVLTHLVFSFIGGNVEDWRDDWRAGGQNGCLYSSSGRLESAHELFRVSR